MKYRKDITQYLIEQLGSSYKNKAYKFYEQNNFLYRAEYDYDNKNKIVCFTNYSGLYLSGGFEQIKQKVEKKFKVKFADKSCDIICKCGESKCFSSFYGVYEISLKCNKCENVFSAYSG